MGVTVKSLASAILLIFHALCFVESAIRESEFTFDSATRPASSLTAAPSVAARSDIECSTICMSVDAAAVASSNGIGCKSWAFSAAPGGRCFLSANRTFDFGTAEAKGAAVYRSPMEIPPTTAPVKWFSTTKDNCTVMVGSRRFNVIQQRVSDKYSFARSYADYENGFGDAENFWIGLKTINSLSGATPRLFRMEALNLQNGLMYVCEYSSFSVADASTQYKLSVSGYLTGSSNTTGESFSYNNNLLFSAMDAGSNTACSMRDGNAGWWFSSCTYVNPNGYFNLSEANNNGDNEPFMQWRYAGPDGTRRMLRSIRLMLQVG